MATIIASDRISNHNVDKYNFKVLSVKSKPDEFTKSSLVNDSKNEDSPKVTADSNPQRRESDIDSSAMSQNSKDALIESLMKKTDEMSSNFIKLQMKLEDKEEEHKNELEKIKESSFEEGMQAGLEKAKENSQAESVDGMNKFANSVSKLEASAADFESALELIKSDLVSAAIDIAQEVIDIEVSHNSNEIAKKLTDELIKELQSASKVTIKVNPKDHGVVSEHVGALKHVTVVSDSALNQGGVVVMSDAGNIDAQISKRFQRVKRAALSE